MPVASRTPEGWPNRCPICGSEWRIEPSQPAGDAPCLVCGQLVWFDPDGIRRRVEEAVAGSLGIRPDQIAGRFALIDDFGADSLDIVELLMGIEEQFQVSIPDEEAAKIKTLDDLIEYIIRQLEKGRDVT